MAQQSFSIKDYHKLNDSFLQSNCFPDNELDHYYTGLKDELEQLLCSTNCDNSFETVQKVMGIDAKIQILKLLAKEPSESLSTKEIISIIEDEYTYYFTEMLGYNKNDNLPNSLLFNIK